MQERRTLWPLLLVVIVAGAASLLAQSFQSPPRPTPAASSARERATTTKQPAPARAAKLTERERRARERTATIETPEFRATISNLSAAISRFELKGQKYTVAGRPLNLVTTSRPEFASFGLDLGGVHVPEDAVWELEALSTRAVRLTWQGNGFRVVRKLEAGSAAYQLWSTVRIENLGTTPRPVRVTATTYHYVRRADEGGGFFATPSPNVARGVCVGTEATKHLDRSSLEAPHRFSGAMRVAGVETNYFTNALSGAGATAEACVLRADDRGGTPSSPDGSLFHARLIHPRAHVAAGGNLTVRTLGYLGPKSEPLLHAAGGDFGGVMDLGFFSSIARGLVWLLSWIHGHVGNWGLAIILLTVLVKVVLFPLTAKSFQSFAALRHLKPEIDRINELYADDREKKGAAIMELYRKHKINPVGGCLPQLLQLPIWWALYTSLSTNVELYHSPFVWYWQDLTAPDTWKILPLSLGVLMYVQQKITPSTMDPVQAKMMLYMMPVMITAFMLFLPSGLCLYMLTNSVLGIGQQKLVEFYSDRAVAAAPAANVTETVAETTSPGVASGDKPKVQRLADRRTRRGRA